MTILQFVYAAFVDICVLKVLLLFYAAGTTKTLAIQCNTSFRLNTWM